jgi:hypothetical protein
MGLVCQVIWRFYLQIHAHDFGTGVAVFLITENLIPNSGDIRDYTQSDVYILRDALLWNSKKISSIS